MSKETIPSIINDIGDMLLSVGVSIFGWYTLFVKDTEGHVESGLAFIVLGSILGRLIK